MTTAYRTRITGIVCAAALLCSNAACIAQTFPAAAYASRTNVSSESGSELTPVIITLDGSTALDSAGTPEALSSKAAQSASEHAGQQQALVIEKLRKKYPALETGEQFTTLINSFSCELPKNLIPYAESLAGVTGVTVSRTVEMQPNLENAAKLGDIPAYYDETGCKGEGQVIAVIDTELNLDHPMFAPLPDDVNVKLTQADVDEIANTLGSIAVTTGGTAISTAKYPLQRIITPTAEQARLTSETKILSGITVHTLLELLPAMPLKQTTAGQSPASHRMHSSFSWRLMIIFQ